MIDQTVIQYTAELKALGIDYKIAEHPEYKAIKDVLDYLHLTFADCLPTLVMKADDTFIAVVFRGDCRVDFKKIKKTFNVKDLRMATSDEFTQLTGLSIGAARVYMPSMTKMYIDTKVLEKEYLYGGSGSFSCSIGYKTADLTKIPTSLIVDIVE
jgi:prolyl-tRNA editing enzyme YbaK/EbsC (Cys-tRNA(Pro) deacylase)